MPPAPVTNIEVHGSDRAREHPAIDELRVAVSGLLPLRVAELQFNDPVVVLVGPNWSVSIASPWRLMRGGVIVTSIDDPNAEARLRELIGFAIIDVVAQASARTSNDPVFVFADGARLEIQSDTDLDPWVMRLPGTTFVGKASGAGKASTEREGADAPQ
jgi:hypothetical protein